jgi:hypothetical protein
LWKDTRLAALATDATRHSSASTTARQRLKSAVVPPAFQLLAEQKGWNDADIVMEEVTIPVAASQ